MTILLCLGGCATVKDPNAGTPPQPIEWVVIDGGKFMMGTNVDRRGVISDAAGPIHEVTVKTFEMSKTAVTVEQYAECVSKGQCTKPGSKRFCNWGKTGRQRHPINCVNWEDANAYARFKGARLPSEAEWEYAAKSGNRNQRYPWGNEEPTCERAVLKGCAGGTMPVCSKPAGNSAQGLCDMAGNVWQWVQDVWRSYAFAPKDGSAIDGEGSVRMFRGGSFRDEAGSGYFRTDYRGYDFSVNRRAHFGFRLARSRHSR